MTVALHTTVRKPASASGLLAAELLSTTNCVVQDVADACRTGAATDIIFGLALGYKSAIIPCIVIAVCIFVSFTLAHMFGIACAALGMLTTLSTGDLLLRLCNNVSNDVDCDACHLVALLQQSSQYVSIL